MKSQNLKFKKFFFLILVVMIFFSQLSLAYAQEVYDYKANSGAQKSITDYLCTPKQADGSGETLFECINKIYKFVIIFASMLAVLFIVIAGYVYMAAEGNQEAVDKAKNILITTVTALVILMGGYVLLKTINPDLVEFRSIQPPGVALPAVAPPTVAAAKTASDILSSGNIILASSHISGVQDNATALKNIQDTAQGNSASLSNYQNAPGGTVALNQSMLNALLEISKTYRISVSEIAGGSHSANSSHYKGTAFDINSVNGVHMTSGNQYTSAIMNLCRQLGATEVLDETASANHVHCAW